MTDSNRTKVQHLLELYKTRCIDKNKLISCIKDIFYSNLGQKCLSLDAIKMHYFLTSIIDSEDLNELEFSKEIKHISEILDGKRQYIHCFATILEAKSDNDWETDRIESIIKKVKNKHRITKDEQEWILKYKQELLNHINSLSDLIIKKIIVMLSLICSNDTLKPFISSAVFVKDEEKCIEEIIETICKYFECLKGKRGLIVFVNYNGEKIDIDL